MRLQFSILMMVVATVLVVSAAAQTGPESVTLSVAGAPGPMALQDKAGVTTVEFEGMDANPVKGAPFCANITTEHTQLFADGNRIHTTSSSVLCRDTRGRIRRESDLNLLGAVPGRAPGKLITIIDPVAGFRYVLDPNAKTASKMPLVTKIIANEKGTQGSDSVPPPGADAIYHVEGAGGPGTFNTFYIARKSKGGDGPAPTTETLGDQTIEGIRATGTRITTTIPAGQMGNEQPILVTSERWYSPELKATVLTKHNDPWAGELKTQFTSVNASEPDPSLFTVPSDYKVLDEQAGPFVINKKVLLPQSPE
jgi:hypothetical protein